MKPLNVSPESQIIELRRQIKGTRGLKQSLIQLEINRLLKSLPGSARRGLERGHVKP